MSDAGQWQNAGIVFASFMNRLGLSRPELRGWVAYDWANSVFMTSVMQVFQVYFASVVAAGLSKAESSARFYTATSVATLVVALLGPLVGAMADFSGTTRWTAKNLMVQNDAAANSGAPDNEKEIRVLHASTEL